MEPLPEQCTCSQAERVKTGWGFRPAQWSPFNEQIMIRVHYGCDRPLYGHEQPVTYPAKGPVLCFSCRIKK